MLFIYEFFVIIINHVCTFARLKVFYYHVDVVEVCLLRIIQAIYILKDLNQTPTMNRHVGIPLTGKIITPILYNRN
jgi:hypothetical protein